MLAGAYAVALCEAQAYAYTAEAYDAEHLGACWGWLAEAAPDYTHTCSATKHQTLSAVRVWVDAVP